MSRSFLIYFDVKNKHELYSQDSVFAFKLQPISRYLSIISVARLRLCDDLYICTKLKAAFLTRCEVASDCCKEGFGARSNTLR